MKSSISARDHDRIARYLDGEISARDFEELQDRLAVDAELRALLRRYLAVQHFLEMGGGHGGEVGASWGEPENAVPHVAPRRLQLVSVAIAAGVAFCLGLLLAFFPGGGDESAAVAPLEEASAMGYAVLSELDDARWADGAPRFEAGQILGENRLELVSGRAEVRFFSGAVMTFQGPAQVRLRSAWEADCVEGAIRMEVPPAARGFVLHAAGTRVVDLGTEFGMVVKGEQASVEVFDGEISLQGSERKEKLVKAGDAWEFRSDGSASPAAPGRVRYPESIAPSAVAATAMQEEFLRWQGHRDRVAADPRVIAYYTFDGGNERGEPILDLRGGHDGSVIIAERVEGRWPGPKSAREFRRVGSRVRVNIPGEFGAFTFLCWARIDSLDRTYNALFMGDGYETGEPHWQIRHDGCLMLSVMVDDSRPNPQFAGDAGFHRVYLSPPLWDISMSGRWVHLCSVFDPENREVSHFVDGEKIERHLIEEDYLIETLRIGNAEIGNWGQPFRRTPHFAIRNLNGRIDELAIYDAALQPEEVREWFEASRYRHR